ncbi:ATP-binding protein [Qipengyuania seohaensis]|uniref:ATP-binding protein n=1 Tax=Qipengyuania seohaensis TaxID=266951 RepID=UPI001E4F4CB9|nr:ATP-binding protein [Qipengyuania seohaensis]
MADRSGSGFAGAMPPADLIGALEEGLVLVRPEGLVEFISPRAHELLFDRCNIEVSEGMSLDTMLRRIVESDLVATPSGVDRFQLLEMISGAIEKNLRDTQLLRRDMTALRVSIRELADGRKAISLIEHVLNLMKPVAANQESSGSSGQLPVVVAKEGFEVPPELSEALEFLEEGFALYDEDSRFILCNRRFCELLFVDPEARPYPGELMDDIVLRAGRTNASKGKPDHMTIEEYSAAATASFKSLAKNQHYELNDGKIMEVNGYRTQPGGYLFTLLDVTAREEAALEAERQRLIANQNEKLSALGELLAGVAHELNNPLSIVVGFSQMLEQELTDERQLRRIGKVRTAAERSARIVKTFLAMARQRPARIERTDPVEIMETAAEVAAYGFRSDGGSISLDYAEDVARIMVDRDQLVQVISNLIVNAEQAMKGMGGAAEMTLQVSERSGFVELSVTDNGPGIDRETQKRIFEPFYTTKDVGEGTGFGLAFCHRIVSAHNGLLQVHSSPGNGSRFVVSLPVAKEAGIEPAEESPGPPSSAMKILVVDDERDVADLLVEMLGDRGHDARAVYAPVDAVRLAQIEKFDIVISDMKMPGMTGDRMMHVMTEARPELRGRFGFVTGDSLSQRVREFLEEGSQPFIEKPIVGEDLDSLLERLRDKVEA